MQNGVPTEMRFAANGTLLGSTPLNGAITSAFTPTTGAVLPGTSVVMSDLPAGVQSAIRSQIGNGRLSQIMFVTIRNGNERLTPEKGVRKDARV